MTVTYDVDGLFDALRDLYDAPSGLPVPMRSEVMKADLRYFWVEHSSLLLWVRSSVRDRIRSRGRWL